MRRDYLAVALVLWTSSAWAQPKQLYVDPGSRGGTCSDAYTRAQNDLTHPWCNLGYAQCYADTPGDTVNLRQGTYSRATASGCCWNLGYSGGCDDKTVLYPMHKGTAANPITWRSYPGERAAIDPAGADSTLVIYGVWFIDAVGRCAAGTRAGKTCREGQTGDCPGSSCAVYQCYNAGAATGNACTDDSDLTTCGTGSCERSGWHWVFDNIKFSNWSWWDQSLTSTEAMHAVGQFPQQYAFSIAQGGRPHSGITIKNSEFATNNGGGAFYSNGAMGITFENNDVHDNWTHGYTSPVNFWQSQGKAEALVNVARNNRIWNNRDIPPPWCMKAYCTAPAGDTTQGNCFDRVTGKGYLCPCGFDSDCASGDCKDHIGSSCGQERRCKLDVDAYDGVPNTECTPDTEATSCGNGQCQAAGRPFSCCSGAGTGSCTTGGSGNNFCTILYDDGLTEGNGIIMDRAQGLCSLDQRVTCTYPGDPVCNGPKGPCTMGWAGNFLIENNVIWNNAGMGINAFVSANATVRNNTTYQNNLKAGLDDGEVVMFGNQGIIANNVAIPRTTGMCSCSSDADCNGRAHACWNWNSWVTTCRNGPRAVCTVDADCAAGRTCVQLPAFKMTYGVGSLTTFTTPPYKHSANLAFNSARANSLLFWMDVGSQKLTAAQFNTSADAVAYGWGGNGGSVIDKQADPLFVAPSLLATADFRLQAGSPASGAGDNALKSPTDAQGTPRATPPEIGAFEDTAVSTTSTTVVTTSTVVTTTVTTTTIAPTTTTTLPGTPPPCPDGPASTGGAITRIAGLCRGDL